jgi:hypothetical protein
MENKMFSAPQRVDIITLLFLVGHIEKIMSHKQSEKWFGESGKQKLTQAQELIFDSFYTDLVQNLSQKEAKKIHEEVKTFNFVARNEKEEHMYIPLQLVYNVVEKAMGNDCSGCSIQKYKKCELYQCLRELNIPAANHEQKNCPYRQ